jgi:hypothetical protein
MIKSYHRRLEKPIYRLNIIAINWLICLAKTLGFSCFFQVFVAGHYCLIPGRQQSASDGGADLGVRPQAGLDPWIKPRRWLVIW